MKKRNPWQTLSTRHIYENPWIKLEEDQVIHPGGGKGIYGKVQFKNYAIGIIPLDQDQNTWLVGQYRYMLNDYSWEIPMGGGPLDHGVLVSAQRELKEETGLLAEKWEMLLKIHTSNSVTDESGFVYLATGLQQSEPEYDETEKLEIKQLSFREVVQMVMDGEITDSLSIAGILKLDKLLSGAKGEH